MAITVQSLIIAFFLAGEALIWGRKAKLFITRFLLKVMKSLLLMLPNGHPYSLARHAFYQRVRIGENNCGWDVI